MIDWVAVAMALVLSSLFQAPLHETNMNQASRYSNAADEGGGTNSSPLPGATSGLDPWGNP